MNVIRHRVSVLKLFNKFVKSKNRILLKKFFDEKNNHALFSQKTIFDKPSVFAGLMAQGRWNKNIPVFLTAAETDKAQHTVVNNIVDAI